jgi:hypothetical protein
VRANLERFALLCANCHFETHYGAKNGAEDLPGGHEWNKEAS